jgi:hypothetical protein
MSSTRASTPLSNMAFTPLASATTGAGPTPGFTPLGQQPAAPKLLPWQTAPDPNLPTPGKPSLANVGYNLAKVPGELSNLAAKVPGAKLGQAVGTSIYNIGSTVSKMAQGNLQGAADTAMAGAKETNAVTEPVIGDTVQAAALPASMVVGGPEAFSAKGVLPFLGRTTVNGGYGAAIFGGNSAANGGNAKQVAVNSGLGFLAGAAGSAGAEGALGLKGVITGSTEPFSAALKQVTPDYEGATAVQKAKLIDQHTAANPRIQEGGVIKGRSVIPNASEQASAAEVAKIPGYDPKATNLQTHTLIQGEIAKQGDALATSLKNEKIIVPKREITSIINKATANVPDESTLIARGDAPLANYVRAAKASIAENDGTLSGVLQVRKDLDAAYANARGKLAYNSDKLAPLDEIHQEARNALNDYMASHAQNTDVKAALKSQAALYRADDVIAAKAAKEGGSTLDRVRTAIKDHPFGAMVSGGLGALGADKLLKATTGVGI